MRSVQVQDMRNHMSNHHNENSEYVLEEYPEVKFKAASGYGED